MASGNRLRLAPTEPFSEAGVISARRLVKVPGDEVLRPLHDVNLEVDAGTLVGLFGRPGSGKSTLLKVLSLRERPCSGKLTVGGADTTQLSNRALSTLRRQLAVVDADSHLRSDRTVAGNVAVRLERLGAERKRRKIAKVLDLVALAHLTGAHPGQLDPGQRRRLAIARAIAVDAAVLLVDEPTDGLDADQAGTVLAALDRARAELGLTILVATADAAVVRKICDRVAIVADGTVIEHGSVLSLLADQSSYTAQALLPLTESALRHPSSYPRVADVVLIGHSTVDSLLTTAADRIGISITTIAGGRTRIAETPVARYRIGLRGSHARFALKWLAEHGAAVSIVRSSRVMAGDLAGEHEAGLAPAA